MKLMEWWPWYELILKTFGFDAKRDRDAANLLSEMIVGRTASLRELRRIISGKRVLVLGAGPSIEKNLKDISRIGLEKFTIITADGAATALMHFAKHLPNVIVTDLDGRMGDIVKANRRGSIAVVHAHGDNIDAIKKYVPRLTGKIVGTTQSRPRPNVYNFGGFTDGDRAAFIAEAFGAKTIVLAGMDLGRWIGKYSKPRLVTDEGASPEKLKKHRMARRLLKWLSKWADAEILNVTGPGKCIEGIRNVSYRDLCK